jgi:putative ABC transport system permease protein
MESVVISERIAKKYFRNDDPLGKTLTLYNQLDLMVTGVMKDLPANSHLQFDFLAHFDILTKQFGYGVGWGNNNYYTYVQLQKNSDIEKLRAEVYEYFAKISRQSSTKFILQSVKDIHLRSYFAMQTWLNNFAFRTSISVWIFALAAAFAITIALVTVSYQSIKAARSNPPSATNPSKPPAPILWIVCGMSNLWAGLFNLLKLNDICNLHSALREG